MAADQLELKAKELNTAQLAMTTNAWMVAQEFDSGAKPL